MKYTFISVRQFLVLSGASLAFRWARSYNRLILIRAERVLSVAATKWKTGTGSERNV